jgi:hypothetical protein
MSLVSSALIFAQQNNTAYQAGQIVGVIFLVVLAGAIIRSLFFKKK